MRNLNDEYKTKRIIYEQQKEYRKTVKGRVALQRAKERQTLKKMHKIKPSHGGGVLPACVECNQKKFELLVIDYDIVLCYNCKYRRNKVLTEEEICQ